MKLGIRDLQANSAEPEQDDTSQSQAQELAVEGCGMEETPCYKMWGQLDRTNDHQVRFCLECCRPVFLVHDESERHVARGNPYVARSGTH